MRYFTYFPPSALILSWIDFDAFRWWNFFANFLQVTEECLLNSELHVYTQKKTHVHPALIVLDFNIGDHPIEWRAHDSGLCARLASSRLFFHTQRPFSFFFFFFFCLIVLYTTCMTLFRNLKILERRQILQGVRSCEFFVFKLRVSTSSY